MVTAGIDFGSTLTKAYWQKDGADRYRSVRPGHEVDGMADEMREDGVRAVRCTGIGLGNDVIARRFEVVAAPEGAVDDEIRLQAAGARLLLERGAGFAPRKFLVASVGTGVSYAVVKGRKAKRSPLGSAHGGGTMMGLARLIGAKSFQKLEAAAAKGTPRDLLVKDQVPNVPADLGELVIAYFWDPDASFEDKCASVFSFAADSIAKDLAVLTSIPFSPKTIVVVGTAAASPVFQNRLLRWSPRLNGRALHIPEHGEYAAAVGAWADISR